MKFSVAPESTRARALALFAIEYMKNQTVIDFWADMYTLLLFPCLISADLIRQRENPQLLPFLVPTSSYHLLSLCWFQSGVEQCDPLRLGPWSFQRRHLGSLSDWHWFAFFGSNFKQSVLPFCNWNMLGEVSWFELYILGIHLWILLSLQNAKLGPWHSLGPLEQGCCSSIRVC